MKWTSSLSEKPSLKEALSDCCQQIATKLGSAEPDLVIGFASPDYGEALEWLPEHLFRQLKPGVFLGCSAGGLIGGGREVEHRTAVALAAAKLPAVEIKPFHITSDGLPDMDDPPDRWEELVGVKRAPGLSFILLPDPYSIQVDSVIAGLDFAFPEACKIGGLASGGGQPGGNALFLDRKAYSTGAVGISLRGNLVVDTIVAQGCRPIGRPLTITRCQDNLLFELEGQPAVNALHEVLVSATEHDQQLAQHSLFLGIVMDEFKDSFGPGDFLIRNILGLESNTGALVVGEAVHNGRTVQFHLRDAARSADDIRLLLKRYSDDHNEKAAGALLFSCLGRGRYLYGESNHDSDCFREYLGEIPLGGFFCNGEIGPVGGATFLHGYTSSFGIFRARSQTATG